MTGRARFGRRQRCRRMQALARWIDASGYLSAGYARELTLASGDAGADWATELQEPIAPK